MSNREIVANEQQSKDVENQSILESEVPPPIKEIPQGVGVFFCMLTLIGTRMGGGIVGIPYATQQIGFYTALWIQIIYSCIAVFAVCLLLRVREITGESSLSNIGYYCYGRLSIFFINAVTALAQLGFPIIFFIVFGDVAGGLIEKVNTSGISFWSSRWFTHNVLAVSMVYLILKKEIHQLKYAGFALLILISIFIVLFFIHYMTSDPHPSSKADLAYTKVGVKFFAFIPTLATSYSIHPSFFTAFLALKYKTTKNGTKAVTLSIGALFIVYIVTPLISFGLYGASIKSNMLKNVAEDNGVIPVILLFLYLMIAVIHIPIIFFIGKEGVLIFFDEATRRSYSKYRSDEETKTHPEVKHESEAVIHNENSHQDEVQNNQPEIEESKLAEIGQHHINETIQERINEENLKKIVENPAPRRADPKEYLKMRPVFYYLLTISCYVIVVLLSIVVGDVSVFFGIIGATAACFMVLLGPGSFYIITVHKTKLAFDGPISVIYYVIAWLLTILGATGMIGLNTCVTLKKLKMHFK